MPLFQPPLPFGDDFFTDQDRRHFLPPVLPPLPPDFVRRRASLTAGLAGRPSPQGRGGDAPVVVANGGFSGLFPGSSPDAFNFALISSSPATILLCDVRLTNDSIGVCLQNLKLDNCTDIASYYPQGQKNYLVNGVLTKGWFSVDYAKKDLVNVTDVTCAGSFGMVCSTTVAATSVVTTAPLIMTSNSNSKSESNSLPKVHEESGGGD
ncbi:putative glycerophosphoryl diester phosphodiesterase 2 [Platanthera guangdongensis]|uniref:glycerophosphodiester phosphodiesterase n=1 Tax=Platanthera guangdongensis TaxID=2320717 RepID=A0ABR2LXG0_9ASPA